VTGSGMGCLPAGEVPPWASMVSEAVAKHRSLRPTSPTGLALHPSGSPGQQHPVMSHSQYLGDAVRSDLVNDKMAGLADPELSRHQSPC
jgi:hypothetical protein